MQWYEIFAELLPNGEAIDDFSKRTGISISTLYRWLRNESAPRPANVQTILRECPPSDKERLLAAFQTAGLLPLTAPPSTSLSDIPSTFYARVHDALKQTPKSLLYWTIIRLVLRQALQQLDPDRAGLEMIVVHCMPPREDKIRSLKEHVGIGTPPWQSDVERKYLFLGAESLAGYAVSQCEFVHHEKNTFSLIPSRYEKHEESAAACPFLRCGQVAGCLLVSSTQPLYFTPERCKLIEQYTNLLALAFTPDEFYDRSAVELAVMPSTECQQEIIRAYQPKQTFVGGNTEMSYWQALEQELFQLS